MSDYTGSILTQDEVVAELNRLWQQYPKTIGNWIKEMSK